MQWRGAAVDPDAEYPEPESWTPVEVPGRPEQFAGADAVAYRTTVEDPRDSTVSRVVLDLRGCYGEATVFCDGDRVAGSDWYFSPLRVPLTDRLGGDTEVRVVCRRPDPPFAGVYGTDFVAPADSVPGIWWDARLRTYPGTYIDAMTARPTVDGDTATVSVSLDVVADEALDDRVTLSVRPAGSGRGRGTMERAAVTAAAGETVTVDHDIEIRDPALWWPAGYGDQHRYEIRAKLAGVERTVSTGFCSVATDGGQLTVNGTPVTARGVNLLDATPADVERARECNANLVRAHAHAAPPEVVDACAEAGVLLWQDLPVTGPGVFDQSRGEAAVASLADRYGSSPALAAVTVQDDPVDPFDSPLGSGTLDRLRFRWRRWRASHDDSAADAAAAAVPEGVLAVPVVGPPGIDADGLTLYPGWRYGDAADVGRYLDRSDPDVVAEFGAGALADGGGTAGLDREAHDAHVDGDDVGASQAYQARVCRRVAEALRQRGVGVMAAFALRDAREAGMGVYGRDGTPKAAAAALASAYEPVQATLSDPTAAESAVVVHNDTDTRFTGRLRWETPVDSGETDVAVGVDGRASVTTIPLGDGPVELGLELGDHTVTRTYELSTAR